MDETSKFGLIPEELLTNIVTNLDDTPSEKQQDARIRAFLGDLKSLRLVSRRFAESDIIRSTLFKRIRLVPAPDDLEALIQIKIDHLARFVKAVAFVAPPYSWVLSYHDFKKSTLAQAVQRYGVHNNVLYTYEPVRMAPRLHRRAGHQPLPRTPIQEMSTRYKDYFAHAMAAKSLLLGKELRAAWISVLEALPHAEDVVIRSPRLVHQDGSYKKAAAPVGDALFTAGVAVLSAAGLRVRSLRIVGLMTGCLDWETLPGWKELDLGRLQSFTFRPRVWRPFWSLETSGVDCSNTSGSDPTETEMSEDQESCEEDEWSSGHGDSSEDDEPRKAEVMACHWNTRSQSVAAVLKKSADSIEKFKYSYLHSMHWPGYEVIPMPKLRYLSLRGHGIHPRNLAAWMAQMPSLSHFKLSFTSASGNNQYYAREWLYIFDAIRNHPKPMGMKVHLFDLAGYTKLFFDCHTNDNGQYEQDAGDLKDGRWSNSEPNRSLILYLNRKIEYNKSLELFFQGV